MHVLYALRRRLKGGPRSSQGETREALREDTTQNTTGHPALSAHQRATSTSLTSLGSREVGPRRGHQEHHTRTLRRYLSIDLSSCTDTQLCSVNYWFSHYSS